MEKATQAEYRIGQGQNQTGTEEEGDQEFWHIVRAFLIRYNEYNREKGASAVALEEWEQTQARMMGQQELKESAINKLTSLELKSDYHNLILLTFLQELARCTSWPMQGAMNTTLN